jgi:hypothetical protein
MKEVLRYSGRMTELNTNELATVHASYTGRWFAPVRAHFGVRYTRYTRYAANAGDSLGTVVDIRDSG